MVKRNSFLNQLAALDLFEDLIKEYHSDEEPDVLEVMKNIKRKVDNWLKTSDMPQGPRVQQRSEPSTNGITMRNKLNTGSFERSMRSKHFPESGPSAFEH